MNFLFHIFFQPNSNPGPASLLSNIQLSAQKLEGVSRTTDALLASIYPSTTIIAPTSATSKASATKKGSSTRRVLAAVVIPRTEALGKTTRGRIEKKTTADARQRRREVREKFKSANFHAWQANKEATKMARDPEYRAFRLGRLRELRASEKSQGALDKMADPDFPTELIVQIFEAMARNVPKVDLLPGLPLERLRKSFLGDSKASETLHVIFINALFKTSRVQINLRDWHVGDGSLPDIIRQIPAETQNVMLKCRGRALCAEDLYSQPQLFRAIQVMSDDVVKFKRLKALTLSVTICCDCCRNHFQPSTWSDLPVSRGRYQSEQTQEEDKELTTLHHMMNQLLDAFKAVETLDGKRLKATCINRNNSLIGRHLRRAGPPTRGIPILDPSGSGGNEVSVDSDQANMDILKAAFETPVR